MLDFAIGTAGSRTSGPPQPAPPFEVEAAGQAGSQADEQACDPALESGSGGEATAGWELAHTYRGAGTEEQEWQGSAAAASAKILSIPDRNVSTNQISLLPGPLP